MSSVTNFLELKNYLDKDIKICGYLCNIRKLKNCTFLIIRRNHISIQCIYKKPLDNVNIESVLEISGKLTLRNDNNKNYNEELGLYEVITENITIVSNCLPLPFPISHAEKNSTDYRERYRFLDLRNKTIFDFLLQRIKAIKFTRLFFDDINFIEINTPIVTGPTADGAGNYYVKSKKHTNKLFALSQSPQIYKQILMCSDIDKYYQIAPCFRDEENRSNRIAIEFTQVDVEIKTNKMQEVIDIASNYIVALIRKLNKDANIKIEQVSYNEVMNKYTTDCVDKRTWLKYQIKVNGDCLEFANIDDIFSDIKNIFSDIYKKGEKIYLGINSDQKDALLMHLSNEFNSKFNEENNHYLLIVTDYPFFEYNKDGEKVCRHNPFSATYVHNNELYAYQYDFIFNGQEIAGGSLREHNIDKLKDQTKDAGLCNFIDMYNYGAMAHGGFAVGLERLMSIIFNTDIINFVPFFTRKNGTTTLVESPMDI